MEKKERGIHKTHIRTCIFLDKNLKRLIKAKCCMQAISLQQLIDDLLKKWLNGSNEKT